MEHVVFYTGHDGSPSFRRVESLTEAVSLIEYLRNSKNVSDTTVFALTAVPLDFKPYYRAEVPAEAYEAVADEIPTVVIHDEAPDAHLEAAAFDHDGTAQVDAPVDAPLAVEAIAFTPEDEAHAPAPHISLVPDLEPFDGAPAPEALTLAPLGFEPIALHHDVPLPESDETREPVVHIGVADSVESFDGQDTHVQALPESDLMLVPTLAEDFAPLAAVVPLRPVADEAPEEATHEAAAQDDSAAPAEAMPEKLTLDAAAAEPTAIEATVHEVGTIDMSGAADVPADENDHLGALAELAAQVAEDAASDSVDEEAVEIRYESEAFAAETDLAGEELRDIAHEAEIAEPEMAYAEMAYAETAEAETADIEVAPALAPEPIAPPVDVLVVSDEAMSQLLAEALPLEAASASAVEVTPAVTSVETENVEALHTRPADDGDGVPHGAPEIDIPHLTDEEIASVSDVPVLPVARTVSPEATGRREGARSLGFFAR
ncbi:MAG: hypothetical protein JWM93_2150 [Frankiales bacterium]|nr:hypothetical protein [Frankiales bacterium]